MPGMFGYDQLDPEYGAPDKIKEEKKDCNNCVNRCIDMDLDPYCAAVNKPWGQVLYTGKPKECGEDSKLWQIDLRPLNGLKIV